MLPTSGRRDAPCAPKTKSPLVSGPSSNSAKPQENLERAKGFEPSTPTLARSCSTTELHPRPKELTAVTPTTGRAMPKAARECNSRRQPPARLGGLNLSENHRYGHQTLVFARSAGNLVGRLGVARSDSHHFGEPGGASRPFHPAGRRGDLGHPPDLADRRGLRDRLKFARQPPIWVRRFLNHSGGRARTGPIRKILGQDHRARTLDQDIRRGFP